MHTKMKANFLSLGFSVSKTPENPTIVFSVDAVSERFSRVSIYVEGSHHNAYLCC